MTAIASLLLTGVLTIWCGVVVAQVEAPTPSPTTVTTLGGAGSQAETRLVNSFTTFAGSEENARSLVTGLRQGSEITLSAPTPAVPAGTGATPAVQTSTGVTFTPPTRPMGYGNVRIALSLAREQLAQQGITQPTPEQLQAALMGSTVTSGTGTAVTTTSFPGVLQMRADGMGWGQIANSMGVKLGHVMSGRTSLPTTVPPPSTALSEPVAAGAGTGVTTAAGTTTTATTQARIRGNSAAAHQAHRPGSGIVTAAGGTAAGVSAGMRVQGGGSGSGVVTGAGAAARANAGGRALARGQARD